MRGRIVKYRIAAVLACISSVSGAPADEAEIRSLISRYYAAANAKDVKGVLSCYAPLEDILVFDVVPPRPFVGVDAITKDWTGYFAAMKVIDLEPAEIRIVVSGDMAYAHFTERVMTGPPGSRQMKLGLRTTHVYRKFEGNWLIVHEHKSKSIQSEPPRPQ